MAGIPPTLAIIVGLAFGSFLGVLVARVPHGLDVVWTRSQCDHCGRQLSSLSLIPVISWAFQGGRCRACRAKITVLWPLLELTSAALFWVSVRLYDAWAALLVAPFLGVLLALSVIDVKTMRLPNQIVLPAATIAALYIGVTSLFTESLSLQAALVGASLGGGFMWLLHSISRRLYGPEAMGFGDVKLAALIGLVVGAIDLSGVAVAIAVAIVLGGLVGIAALAMGLGRKAAVPFGPMLGLGALTAITVGPQLVDSYLSLYR